MSKLQIFATDICEGNRPHCSREREEISDMYWFEEEGVHDMTGKEHFHGYHDYKFEVVIDGKVVWTSTEAA